MSGSVFLSNLDDFIAPSQACVNPLINSKLDVAITSKGPAKISLETDYSATLFESSAIKPDLIKTKIAATSGKKIASVSLNDCLACSGCVTSAEAMLIQEQSVDKLQEILVSGDSVVIVTVSPNSIASLANSLKMSYSDAFLKICSVLKNMGVKYVLDASSGGDVALFESRHEFIKRNQEGPLRAWHKHTEYSSAESATEVTVFRESNSSESQGSSQQQSGHHRIGHAMLQSHLPVLTSNCPGWVCFAEKTQPQCLPYLSTVKSAQQICGSIIKTIIFPLGSTIATDGIEKRIAVVSIQPCFDKKLEMSRKDFLHKDSSGRDDGAISEYNEVDLVISTGEFLQFLTDSVSSWKHIAVASVVSAAAVDVIANGSANSALDAPGAEEKQFYSYFSRVPLDAATGVDDIESLFRCFSDVSNSVLSAVDSNAGSGAYSEYLFRYAAEHVCGIAIPPEFPLQYKIGRNEDIAEIDISDVLQQLAQHDKYRSLFSDLAVAPTSRKLKFGRAYGFRNIQSIMTKLRRGVCELDFIEMMACPSGCNNGGGQIKGDVIYDDQSSASSAGSSVTGTSQQMGKRRSESVERLFHSGRVIRQPDDSPLVQFLYEERGGGQELRRRAIIGRSRLIENRTLHSLPAETAACDDAKIHAHSTTPAPSQGMYFSSLPLTPLSEDSRALLHTRYHAVPKLEIIAPLAAKW